VAASVAILEVLREKGFDFQGAAGHSLGEYCAYVAAGKMDMEEAVKLVRKRGELMANADPEQKGGMAAVMRMDAAQVEEICDKYNEVVPANYNCPGQIVISGDKAQIDLAAEEIKNAKGRVMPLQVSGPFHSPLMREAALEFSKELEKVSFDASRVPVYANVDAKPVQHGEEKESLTRQIYSSVKWTQTIENMIKDGFDTFVEVGPGKVLQGLIKKINRDVKIIAVTEVTDLEKMEI
jgi:[acyl-carrier-protein] S-malonyltransferase